MHRILPFLAILAFVFGSCEKDGLNYTERRIVGNWKYTKVKYTRDWSVDVKDITEDFLGYEIQFNADFSARIYNGKNGDTGTGLWELTQTSNGDDCTNIIYASFTDDVTGELSQVVFENAGIYKSTIRAVYDDPDGRYRYVLKRQ